MLGRQFSPRELLLATIALVVIIGVPVGRRILVPAWSEWRDQQQRLVALSAEHQELMNNLEIRASVEEAHGKLDDTVWQTESPEISVSRFLRDVEAASRRPGLTITSMQPLPPEHAASHSIYRVRLTVSGRLQDITRFVTELMAKLPATGTEGFSIRGVQGGQAVEATLMLRTVRLKRSSAALVAGASQSPFEEPIHE